MIIIESKRKNNCVESQNFKHCYYFHEGMIANMKQQAL